MSSIVAVSQERHGNQFWRGFQGFSFAAETHAVPLSAQEIGHAARTLPLGFVQSPQGPVLVALLGLRPGQNLFVAPDGRWLGGYVPAALRGYPFRLGQTADKPDNFTLAVDEGSMLVGTDPIGGTPFFENGAPHPRTKQMLDFLIHVRNGAATTARATKLLADAGLLQPWGITIEVDSQRQPVNGISMVAESALQAKDGEAFLALRTALPIAYAQLISMQNLPILERLSKLHAAHAEKKAQAEKELFTPAMEDEKFDWKALFQDD